MLQESREIIGVEEAATRLAVALADAARNAHALADAAPQVSDQMRRASLSLVRAARAVTAAVEVLAGGERGAVH